MQVSITRGRWKSSYSRSKAEFDYSTWAELDVSVSACYCSVAIIIHGTWFPLESSVLNPRYDTLVSDLFLGGTFSDTGQDLRVSLSLLLLKRPNASVAF